MTGSIRHALTKLIDARMSRDPDLVASYQEELEAALVAWKDSELKVAVRTCIRIASECHGTDVSPADAMVSHFDAVL